MGLLKKSFKKGRRFQNVRGAGHLPTPHVPADWIRQFCVFCPNEWAGWIHVMPLSDPAQNGDAREYCYLAAGCQGCNLSVGYLELRDKATLYLSPQRVVAMRIFIAQ